MQGQTIFMSCVALAGAALAGTVRRPLGLLEHRLLLEQKVGELAVGGELVAQRRDERREELAQRRYSRLVSHQSPIPSSLAYFSGA